nr:histidine kinase dimerization/phospho-acceptor domain-containing protein [Luteimonas saliphila]
MDRVAHDLRGPLAPMQTAVYLLREPGLGDAQRHELLAVLERQIQRLGGMIDEFGDLGRAQMDRLVGRREAIDIESLVADITERLGARPPQVSLAPEVRGFAIEGDALRIAQLFHALLGVRLARGAVAPVRARLELAGGCLRLTCTAYCSGATNALVGALLTSPHPDPPDDSLGLGLVLAAAIARAHGGRMHGRASASDTAELVLELPPDGGSSPQERARG